MYAYIKGILVQTAPTSVVIEAQGIGYKIFVPASIFSQLPQINSSLTVYTAFIVRELAHAIYGFISMQERDFFEELIGVKGIGPKIGLALIGHMPIHELQRAISNGDAATLSRVPGIGKKGAERLIIELRDKVRSVDQQGNFSAHFLADPHLQAVNDAVSALINLGYNQSVAQKAIKKSLKEIPEAIDLGELIASALKNI